MLINNALYLTVSILLPILVWIGLTVFIKRKFDNYYGALLGLVLSGFIFGFFQFNARKMYVIHDDKEYSAYSVVGEGEYTLSTGEVAKIKFDENNSHLMIVNDSKKNVVIKEIKYKSENNPVINIDIDRLLANLPGHHEREPENTDIVIESGEYGLYPLVDIDYFFGDKIPKEIETSSHGTTTKYRLRYKY